MKRIAIYGNNYQDGYLSQIGDLLTRLASADFEVFVYSKFADYLCSMGVAVAEKFAAVEEFPAGIEYVINIGGDGTFLRASEWVGKSGVPIAGINTGHLGFLASFNIDEIPELVSLLASDGGMREHRMVLKVECAAMPSDFWPYALNEVSVQKGETASMVTVNTEIDGEYLADYQADGLVVATPTGSTAYNLSVGGPIVQPTMDCVVLSPIAPHSLTMRPLVVAGGSEILLRAVSREPQVRVSLDGRSFLMDSGSNELRIAKGDYDVVVLRRVDANYPRLLRTKLHWGV